MLLLGLFGSQWLPGVVGPTYATVGDVIRVLTMAGLSFIMLAVAYGFLHQVRIPVTWSWVLGYAVVIAGFSEFICAGTKLIDESVPIHIEVLLPAFVLGAIMAYPHGSETGRASLTRRSRRRPSGALPRSLLRLSWSPWAGPCRRFWQPTLPKAER